MKSVTRLHRSSAIQAYRELLVWDSHPLVIRAVRAHDVLQSSETPRRTSGSWGVGAARWHCQLQHRKLKNWWREKSSVSLLRLSFPSPGHQLCGVGLPSLLPELSGCGRSPGRWHVQPHLTSGLRSFLLVRNRAVKQRARADDRLPGRCTKLRPAS